MKLFTKVKKCDFCNTILKNPYKPINTKRFILTYQCNKCLLLQSLPQKKFKSHPKPSMSFDADRSSIMYTKELVLPRHINFFNKNKVNFKKFNFVLDIGSNRGSFLKYALKKNPNLEITAIETRKELIKNYCKNRNVLSFHTRYETFNTTNKYDFIYNAHTLEHLTSCAIGIKKMRDSLSSDGFIFLAVPNINSIDKKTFEEVFIDPHTFHFTHKTMLKYFNKFGLVILKKNIKSNELQYLLTKKNNSKIKKDKTHKKLLFFDKIDYFAEYRSLINRNRKQLKNFAQQIKKLSITCQIVFWGAGRIFDGLVKLGKLKPKGNLKVVDISLFKYFKKVNGFKVFHPNTLNIDQKKNILVICSREYKDQILKQTKKYSFKKILLVI